MKKLILLTLFCGMQPVHADSPALPIAYVTAAYRGQYLFMMKPKLDEKSEQLPNGEKTYGTKYDDGAGIAYEVLPLGGFREIWRTDGWYSFEVFLAIDGLHLVRMGPWNGGHEPQPDDLAVAFYREGKLIRKYSTVDLVKDKSKIQRSTSHYFWLARDDFNSRSGNEPAIDVGPKLGWDGIFSLKTIDGISYRFDVTSGEILK